MSDTIAPMPDGVSSVPEEETLSMSQLQDSLSLMGSSLEKLLSLNTKSFDDKSSPNKQDVAGVGDMGALYLADLLEEQKEDEKKTGFFDKLFGGLAGTSIGAMAATLFPKLMAALPWLALAGGIIWGVMDGIVTMGKSEEWGVRSVSGFLGGFFGGKGSGWTNVLPNAAKGALAGLGIGMLAFGPIGAIAGLLIGGIIGGILGFIGPEKIARFIDGTIDAIMKDPALAVLLGGATGATIGIIGGPVGMLVGGLIGMALGGIGISLASEDPIATAKDLLTDPRILAMGGALTGGLIGLVFGPIGLVVGMIIGGALGAISGFLIEEKERTGRTLKEQLRGVFIQPFIDIFQSFKDFFRTIKLVFEEKGGLEGLLDIGTFLTGFGGVERLARVKTIEETVQAESRINKLLAEEARIQSRKNELTAEIRGLAEEKRAAATEFGKDSPEWLKVESKIIKRLEEESKVKEYLSGIEDERKYTEAYLQDLVENGIVLNEVLLKEMEKGEITMQEFNRIYFGATQGLTPQAGLAGALGAKTATPEGTIQIQVAPIEPTKETEIATVDNEATRFLQEIAKNTKISTPATPATGIPTARMFDLNNVSDD